VANPAPPADQTDDTPQEDDWDIPAFLRQGK